MSSSESNPAPVVPNPTINTPVIPLPGAPKTHPIRRAIKYFFLALVLVIILIIGLVLSLSIFAKDIPPIDERDLTPVFNNPSRQDNIYYDLNEVKDKAKETPQVMEYLENKSWDTQSIKMLLDENTETFKKMDQAAGKTAFQDPYYADSKIPVNAITEEPPLLTAYQKLARLNTLRAIYLINEGKTEEGVTVILGTLNIGDAFEKSGDSMIVSLVGSSIKKIALQGLHQAAPKLNYTKDQLSQLSEELKKHSYKSEGLSNGFKHEYKYQTYSIDSLSSGRENDSSTDAQALEMALNLVKKSKFYYKPNETKQLYADLYRAHLKEAAASCSQIKPITIQKKPNNVFFQENGLGLMLFNLTAITLNGTINTKCIVDFNLNSTRVLLALRAYQADKSSLPNSLQELTPAYISSLPLDPYDDQPIKYSKSKKVIYSVGKDKINTEAIADSEDLDTQNYRKLINF